MVCIFSSVNDFTENYLENGNKNFEKLKQLYSYFINSTNFVDIFFRIIQSLLT